MPDRFKIFISQLYINLFYFTSSFGKINKHYKRDNLIRLGSNSQTRALILRNNNIDFIQNGGDFDEDSIKTKDPKSFVYQATLGKYNELLKKYGVEDVFTGVVLAVLAFFVTYFELKKSHDLSEFRGYPLQFDTLTLPVILALLVLVTNHYYPEIKVILLISLFSIVLTSLILPFKLGIKKAIKSLNFHVTNELPKMKNEIGLFLIAGMFGVSISTLLVGFHIEFPFEKFDGFSASIILLVQILLSFVGIHPIITIAIIGNWTGGINHTLLAMTFLMAWSTSVCTSPFSGVNLTMQARYGLNTFEIFKTNFLYALKMYIICVIILFLLANYLGI